MPSLIFQLSNDAQAELLDDLNYLNMSEIKSFCRKHAIPYTISIASKDGNRTKTSDQDRKGVILHRIRRFLTTGTIPCETCFPASVTRFDPLPGQLNAEDRLYYGQYDKNNVAMISVLKSLTHGKFRNGAVARMLAREFWTRGEAPTFQQFAAAWLRATEEHTQPNPEWAFLSDMAAKKPGTDWKKMRNRKANAVTRLLSKIPTQKKKSN